MGTALTLWDFPCASSFLFFLIKDDVAILILTPENLVPEMWQIILSIKDDQAVSHSVMFRGKIYYQKKCLLELSYNTE